MKIRRFKEETKIKIEDLDDLWYLKSVLAKEDEISGVSYRRLRDETKARADKGERVRVYLSVKLDDSEFHKHSKTLRITGPITKSSDPNVALGSYHTIEIGVGDEVNVKKQWKRWQLDRLKEAEQSARVGIVLIVSVEEGEADFAVLRRYGIDYAFRISTTISGKEVEEGYITSTKGFYDSVSEKILEIKKKEEVTAVIVCGPGFAKDKIMDRLREKKIEGIFLEAAGCAGRPGIQEVLKRGIVEKIVEESRVAVETRMVEELFKGISTNGMVSYGIKEVESAAELGAIETLLVTYTFLQKHNPDRLMEKVKQRKGNILVVSPEHDAGERLDAIGGIGALLRFRIS